MKRILASISNFRYGRQTTKLLSLVDKGKYEKAAKLLDVYSTQIEKLKIDGDPVLYSILADYEQSGRLFEEMNKLEKAKQIYNQTVGVVFGDKRIIYRSRLLQL